MPQRNNRDVRSVSVVGKRRFVDLGYNQETLTLDDGGGDAVIGTSTDDVSHHGKDSAQDQEEQT